MHLSLVLPCFRDADHVFDHAWKLVEILRREPWSFELILVNDASPDGTAAELERFRASAAAAGVPVTVLEHERNLGRGAALRTGFRAARGEACAFIDIDLEPDPEALIPMVKRALAGTDVVVGRRSFQQEKFSPLRFVVHHAHKRIATTLLRLPVHDTHTGLKVFRRSVLPSLLDRVADERWFWDTEIVAVAKKAELRIEEYPLRYRTKACKATTVKFATDSCREARALLRYLWRRDRAALFAGVALTLVLVAGMWLRLRNPTNIELKSDEAQILTVAAGDTIWPAVGLDTSNGLNHPGFGLVPFTFAASFMDSVDPVKMAQVTQMANCLALLLLFLFVVRFTRREPRPMRHAWAWAFCMIAFNPLYVLWERKIWQPSILPLFFMVILISWWKRHESRKVSFVLGFFLALSGQVHLSAYFFAAGLVLGTFLLDKDRARISPLGFFGGAALGLMPLVPWIWGLLHNMGSGGALLLKPHRILQGKFFNYFLSNPLGFSFRNSLGGDLEEFLSFPRMQGEATYLNAAAYGVLLSLVAISAWIAWQKLRQRTKGFHWSAGAISRFRENCSQTDLLLVCAFLVCGLLTTLSCINITRYFFLCMWPLPALFFARLLVRHQIGTKVLGALLVTHLFLSSGVLSYISGKTTIRGEFGIPYHSQSKLRRWKAPQPMKVIPKIYSEFPRRRDA